MLYVCNVVDGMCFFFWAANRGIVEISKHTDTHLHLFTYTTHIRMQHAKEAFGPGHQKHTHTRSWGGEEHFHLSSPIPSSSLLRILYWPLSMTSVLLRPSLSRTLSPFAHVTHTHTHTNSHGFLEDGWWLFAIRWFGQSLG